MSSVATLYRKEHPEYYAQERIRDNERVKNLYHSNPDYKEKVKQQALARYYRLKEAKKNASIVV
jgi:hypothetical protein